MTASGPATWRLLADGANRVECSGLPARWCPNHGHCTCRPDLDDTNGCPLHSAGSQHPIERLSDRKQVEALGDALREAADLVDGQWTECAKAEREIAELRSLLRRAGAALRIEDNERASRGEKDRWPTLGAEIWAVLR